MAYRHFFRVWYFEVRVFRVWGIWVGWGLIGVFVVDCGLLLKAGTLLPTQPRI